MWLPGKELDGVTLAVQGRTASTTLQSEHLTLFSLFEFFMKAKIFFRLVKTGTNVGLS